MDTVTDAAHKELALASVGVDVPVDGFAGGVLYALLTGRGPQEAVEWGAAHGALAQSTRGDTSMVTREEVEHVVRGGSARIKR